MPSFIQPTSIKLNIQFPKKLSITTSFLPKTVTTLNDRLVFNWRGQSLDSNSGCHATVHARMRMCDVRVRGGGGGGVKDTVQSLKSLTVSENSQPENKKNCSESQS